ncbi:MAG: hypothetical protein ABI947_00335 [Chloroflexota bacterium]
MFDSNNPSNSSRKSYNVLKKSIRDIMFIELEGTLNPNSPEEMIMVENLFGEILEEQNVVLSRVEKKRLFDDLVNDIAGGFKDE